MTETNNNNDIDETLLNGQMDKFTQAAADEILNEQICNNLVQKQLYVVELSFGFMDDYYTVINGIFDNLIVAENICKTLNDETGNIKSLAPKIIEDDNGESEDLYDEYYMKYKKAMDFNIAVVREFELNKINLVNWHPNSETIEEINTLYGKQ